MNTIDVDSWEEFVDHLIQVRSEHDGCCRPLGASDLLYRGHGNSNWQLLTTLERSGWGDTRLKAYYALIDRLSAEIETMTQQRWGLPEAPVIFELLSNYHPDLRNLPESVFRYMLYLRHHGFPSPLLDWSRSPYVAAFFAFRNADIAQSAERCSIYIYSESPKGFKLGGTSYDNIIRIGQYLNGVSRHFLQQSNYTLCVRYEQHWDFARHEDAFDRNDEDLDRLTKITIPTKERKKVLQLLGDYNLNAYSLFASEEGLMEAMAHRAIDCFDPPRR